MILLLIAVISGQLSTPLNLNGQAITRVSCDGGLVCTKTGTSLTIISTSSGGGGGGSGGAPVDGGYVIWSAAATTGSTNERVLTAGTNITLDTATPGQLIVNASGGGGSSSFDGGYNRVQDEGVDLTKRATIDFTGAGVTCTDTGAKTSCDIPGGGGGASQSPLSVTLGTP